MHALQALVGESLQQQVLGRGFAQPARAQVKQRIFVDLADGGAMRALHIVGVDFQLWLGIDLSLIGEQQVAIGLLGISLLRVFMNDNASVKDTMRVAVQDSVVKLAAVAM